MGDEDPGQKMSARLVRWDLVQVWAPHVYGLQALPAMQPMFVTQAVLSLLSTDVVGYQEVRFPRFRRLYKQQRWYGNVRDVGPAQPAPLGFEIAKRSHLRPGNDCALVLAINGHRTLVWFTGLRLPPPRNRIVALGEELAFNLSGLAGADVGTVVDWYRTGKERWENPRAHQRAHDAATTWAAVLDGSVKASSLPTVTE
jgi:hypothetical protein